MIFDPDTTVSQVFIAGSATAVAVSSAAAEAGTETMPGYQKLEQDEEQPDCRMNHLEHHISNRPTDADYDSDVSNEEDDQNSVCNSCCESGKTLLWSGYIQEISLMN